MTDFQSIYNGNYNKLFRVAMKMVGNGDSARDIVHDVFVRYYERKMEGHLILYPSSWLYRVVINKCIDSLKRATKFQTIRPSDHERADDPEDMKEQKITMVQAALSVLNPHERALVVLYSEGLSYKEIAESSGMRFSSVGKTLSRTLEKLENELKKQKYELY
ncbi:MAG: sigma-70 family RNA polymerase sigma factor [Bacteroidetes bacterium]|nr:sigma-70 family RNA polymerase sigma factor [Bacteroidota bacterium]